MVMHTPPAYEQSPRTLEKESAELYAILLSLPNPTEIYLPDGALFMANAAARSLPSFPADRGNGCSILSAHSDDRLAFSRAVSEKKTVTAPERCYTLPSLNQPEKILHMRTNCTPVCDAEGQIRHVIVSREDITSLHLDARFRRLVEDACEAILVVQDGRIKYFNRKALQITGYPEDSFYSQPFDTFIHPEDRELVMQRSLLRLQGMEIPNIYQFRVIDAKGEAKWLQINADIIDWEGKPAILAFLPDITQLRNTEMALWESEIRFQMISENTGDLIILSDGLGKTIFVNSALTSLLGLQGEELQGRPLTDIIHPKYRSALSRLWNRILAKKPVAPQETILVRRDGSHLPAEISCFAVEQENNAPYLGSILRDISVRKAAENELEQYRDHLEKLVGMRTSELTQTNSKLAQTILEQEQAEEKLSRKKASWRRCSLQ